MTMNPENLYFIDTPVDIQDECYDTIINYLENFPNIGENDIIYLKYTSVFNMGNKGFFKGYISTQIKSNKDLNEESDFLIFIE